LGIEDISRILENEFSRNYVEVTSDATDLEVAMDATRLVLLVLELIQEALLDTLLQRDLAIRERRCSGGGMR